MSDPKILSIVIHLCEDCFALKGEQCNNPDCVFCRRSMREVGDMLDALLIRPVINGRRLSVEEYPAQCVARDGGGPR